MPEMSYAPKPSYNPQHKPNIPPGPEPVPHPEPPIPPPSPQEQLKKRLDTLSVSPQAYNQLVEEYKTHPQLLGSIVSHAKTKLPPSDRLQVYTPLLSSGEYSQPTTYEEDDFFISPLVVNPRRPLREVGSDLDHQLMGEIRTTFQEIPKSVQKLRSLLTVSKSVKPRQSRFSEELSAQAIELASTLASTSIYPEEAYSEAANIIRTLDTKDAQDAACKQAIAQLPTRPAIRGTLSLTNDKKLQFELLNQIKQKALETGDFNKANTSIEFVNAFLSLSDVKPSSQQIKGILPSTNYPYDRIQVCAFLVNTIMDEAINPELLNEISTIYRQINDSETKLQSLIDVANSLKKSQSKYSAKLTHKAIKTASSVVVAKADIESATKVIDAFQSSNERIKVRRRAVLRLEKSPESLKLLSDAIQESSTIEELRLIKATARRSGNFNDTSLIIEYISRISKSESRVVKQEVNDVFSKLVEEEQFETAKEVLAKNKAVAKDVALVTSEKTPGFALYALEEAIKQDKELIYSEIHAQTIANAAKQIAKYSSEMAKRVLTHAIEVAHELAKKAKVEPQKRREFYRRISLPPNGGGGRPKGNGSGRPIAIQVILEAEFNSFVTEKETLFIEELADMLRISPDDILILNKWEGSTVYKLGFEIERAGLIFKFKFEKQDKDILNFQLIIKTSIVSVEIVRTTEGEKAEARRNKVQTQSLEPRANNVLEVQLAENIDINTAAVYVTKSPIGYTAGAAIKLPFTTTQFQAILKALEQMAKPSEPTGNESPENYISNENGNWKPSQIEALNEQELISENGIKLVTGNLWRKILLYFWRRLLHGEMKSLFQRNRWWLILKVVFQPNIQHFSSSQIKMLCEMELINGASLDRGYFLKRIGGVIYESLTSNEDINYVLRSSIEQVKDLAFRLEVNKNALHLARYPWELINKRDYFLLDKLNLDLARSISGGPARSLKVSSPLKILYVESRPGPNPLPRDEFKVVKAAFQNLGRAEEKPDDVLKIVIKDTGLEVELKTIWSPTYKGLIDHLNENDYHILHFDGHGQFGRRCPNCGKLHHVPEPTCLRCGKSVLEIPRGFLQFENDQQKPDWISSEEFYCLLARKSLRLVVLSACLSGKTYDETVFAGTAQALLKSAIPAVVAMQFQIGTTDACEFLQGFYGKLAETGNVRQAIQAGRHKLKRQPSWYVPALYLRGEDVLGQLFDVPVLERTQ